MSWKTGLAACVASAGLLAHSYDASAQQQDGNGSGYNWSGFYGGGNLGGAFGGSDFLSGLGNGVPFFEGVPYPGGAVNPATPGIIAAYRANDVDIKSLTGGLQTGYNFWAGGLLFGVELDINFLSAQKAKTTRAYGLFDPVFGTTLYTFRNEIDANYIFSARPRIGMPMGSGILYATGGVAVTTLKYDHSFRATGGFFNGLTENASASETKAGWTVGAGFEMPIGPSATWRTEYLFTDFGDVSTSGNKISPLGGFGTVPAIADVACGVDTGQAAPFGLPPGSPTPRQCFKHKADLVLHTLRLGLNFKF